MGERAVMITGAGGGLGRMLARRFAANGVAVALLGRRLGPLQETAQGLESCCPGHLVLPTDIRDPQAVDAAMSAVSARWDGLHALVNNAALLANPHGQSVDPWTYFECVLHTNIKGPALMAERAVPLMVPGGVIINVSSSAGARPTPDAVAYGASKAALDHLTATLAVRYAPSRIRVVGVAPGGLFNDDDKSPTTEEATVQLVVYLASRHGSRINGTTLQVDDGESVRTFAGRKRGDSGRDGEGRP
jgi:NAD(P)-dependent dehydrogenase (short-subunit alcohol dehydrogenase family)